MAQAISTGRFSVNRSINTVLAAGLIVAGVAGVTALNTQRDTTSSIAAPVAIVAPKAHYNPNQGEGIGALVTISSPQRAHYAAGMGEGLVGNSLLVSAPTATAKAHYSPNQGEGIGALVALQATPVAPLQAHYVAGQGEGLVSNLFAVEQPAPRAFYVEGMGEGLVGNTFARESRVTVAYHVDGMGEGIIGGSGR